MNRLFALTLIFALLPACATHFDSRTMVAPSAAEVALAPTFYVSRHMQKESGSDPALTAEGQANAQRLADMLADKGIVAIFSTDTKRTRATAEPLSRLTGVPIQTYDPRDNQALAARAQAITGSVLIVGHSNTVPAIVVALKGEPVAPIDEETGFGLVFAVDRSTGKTAQTKL